MQYCCTLAARCVYQKACVWAGDVSSHWAQLLVVGVNIDRVKTEGIWYVARNGT